MKTMVLLFVCLIAAVFTSGQELKSYPLPEAVITPPELLIQMNGNGNSYLNDYLKSNIQYPKSSAEWDEEGVEVIQFVVTPKGEIADIEVINSVSPGIDAEVIRVLKTTSGMWRPSHENGNPVLSTKEVSIAFSTDEDGINPSGRFLWKAKQEFVAGNKKFFVKKNNKSALYFFDRALCYMPFDKSILLTRGMCKYQLGDKAGACKDWNRIKTLGGMEGDSYLNSFCEMEGYREMTELVLTK
jgi:hypothetical protein